MSAIGLSGETCCLQRLSYISDANKFDAVYWVRRTQRSNDPFESESIGLCKPSIRLGNLPDFAAKPNFTEDGKIWR